MTEIKIEKKKPLWPWILLIVVLAAIAYYTLTREDVDDDNSTIENSQETSMITLPETVYTPYRLTA